MVRLDSSKGDRRGWTCIDMRTGTVVKDVAWLDEATATWGRARKVFDCHTEWLQWMFANGPVPTVTHKEDRIRIVPDCKLVFFNELEGIDVQPVASWAVLGELISPVVRMELRK